MSGCWKFVNAVEEFGRYRQNWEKLSKDILKCDYPLANFDYVEPIIKHFAPKDLLLGIKGRVGEEGMALIQRTKNGAWQSFSPKAGPFTFALLKNNEEGFANESIESLIRSLPGFTILFKFCKLDPSHLTVKVKEKKMVEKTDYIETLNIPTNDNFDKYWKERGKNLKRDVIKKNNRIKKDGIQMFFHDIKDPDLIHKGVEVYGNLESNGWKGKMGSAVHIDNDRGAFFVDMLQRFAKKKQAAIYQLIFNGNVVASAFTIWGGKMAFIHKITYDESYKQYSPGLVMMYELHKKLFAKKDIENIEYYGNATLRQKQWSNNIRMLYHVNYYRNTYIKNLVFIKRKIKHGRKPITDIS